MCEPSPVAITESSSVSAWRVKPRIFCLRRDVTHAAMAWMAFAGYGRVDVGRGQPDTLYRCPNRQRDDLGNSGAMLAWAARHPHLTSWCRIARPVRPSHQPSMSAAGAWRAFT